MSGHWTSSDRRAQLPPDWRTTRARVLTRDGHRCRHLDTHGRRCPQPATDVDHAGDRHDHSDHALQSLCSDHHKAKTQTEAQAANRAWAALGRRPTETHPALASPRGSTPSPGFP